MSPDWPSRAMTVEYAASVASQMCAVCVPIGARPVTSFRSVAAGVVSGRAMNIIWVRALDPMRDCCLARASVSMYGGGGDIGEGGGGEGGGGGGADGDGDGLSSFLGAVARPMPRPAPRPQHMPIAQAKIQAQDKAEQNYVTKHMNST